MYSQGEKRLISDSQRRNVFRIVKAIASHIGHTQLDVYEYLKTKFTEVMDLDEQFSLKASKCDLWLYEIFIEYVFDFYLTVGANSNENIKDFFEQTDAYVRRCLKHKVCCITGEPGADIHHVDTIGMGNNRNHVDHSKLRRMPLSRRYHTMAHTIGQEAFERKFHVRGIYSHYHTGTNDIIDEISYTVSDDTDETDTHIFNPNQVQLFEGEDND